MRAGWPSQTPFKMATDKQAASALRPGLTGTDPSSGKLTAPRETGSHASCIVSAKVTWAVHLDNDSDRES